MLFIYYYCIFYITFTKILVCVTVWCESDYARLFCKIKKNALFSKIVIGIVYFIRNVHFPLTNKGIIWVFEGFRIQFGLRLSKIMRVFLYSISRNIKYECRERDNLSANRSSR